MPYIDQKRRDEIHDGTDPELRSPGELTYILYLACLDYLKDKDRPIRYADLAEVLGAISATNQEFYRRVVAPYEDKKIAENGDVTA